MPNPVIHFEIGCTDKAKTAEFYTQMFGWDMSEFGPATMINTGSSKGITGHITALGHEPSKYTIFYVKVDDVQAALDKAAALGGKTLVPPVTIPMGVFAWFADPEGNTVGLIKTSMV